MGNRTSYAPPLGEAARTYRLPSECVRQQALKQKELAATLKENGRKGIESKDATLPTLRQGTLVPAAYHKNGNEHIQTTQAIKRDYRVYQHVFEQAKRRALEIELQFDTCTSDQRFLIHLYALQEAINKLIRPDQDQAEGHMKDIINTADQKGETIINTQTVKSNDAELCNLKSMIAKHYFQEYFPEAVTTMANAAEHKGGTDGHNFLHVEHEGISYEYHANSPHNGLPHITGLSKEQEEILQELQKMSTERESKSVTLQIRHSHVGKNRLAA